MSGQSHLLTRKDYCLFDKSRTFYKQKIPGRFAFVSIVGIYDILSVVVRNVDLVDFEVRRIVNFYSILTFGYGLTVAPHAGAWIETRRRLLPKSVRLVAPHAGAWIETWPLTSTATAILVAPHAGAWIETFETRTT